MVAYGLTMGNQNLINEKALTKNNGCYRLRGVAYRVVNGKVTHFAINGEIIAQYGYFNSVVGSYEWNFGDSSINALRKLKTK